MLLREKETGHFVEVLDITSLTNPFCQTLSGRLHWGEDVADAETYDKDALCFASGEPLPECWVNDHYRDADVFRRTAVAAGLAPGTESSWFADDMGNRR